MSTPEKAEKAAFDPYCPEHGHLPTTYDSCSCVARARLDKPEQPQPCTDEFCMHEHRAVALTQAVERAATAWFDRIQAVRRDDARKAPDGGPWRWEHLTEDDKHAYRALVEPIVSAAFRSDEGTAPRHQSPSHLAAQPQPSQQPTPRPALGSNEAGCASASRGTPGDVELAVSGPGAGGAGVAVAEDDVAELVAVDRGDGDAVLVEAVAREDFGCGDERLGHESSMHGVDTRVNTQDQTRDVYSPLLRDDHGIADLMADDLSTPPGGTP